MNDHKDFATRPALTDEEFCERLFSHDASAADGELEDVRNAVANYREMMSDWAHRRSAAQPSLAAAARRSRFWAAVPQWSLAAVAMMTVAVTAGMLHLNNAPNDTTEAIHATTDAAHQLMSADNDLLISIDAVVNASTDLPVIKLGLERQSFADDGRDME